MTFVKKTTQAIEPHPDISRLQAKLVAHAKLNTVDRIAYESGLGRGWVHAFIQGKVQDPGYSRVVRLAHYLKFTLSPQQPQG